LDFLLLYPLAFFTIGVVAQFFAQATSPAGMGFLAGALASPLVTWVLFPLLRMLEPGRFDAFGMTFGVAIGLFYALYGGLFGAAGAYAKARPNSRSSIGA
jgi:hypothetical protein